MVVVERAPCSAHPTAQSTAAERVWITVAAGAVPALAVKCAMAVRAVHRAVRATSVERVWTTAVGAHVLVALAQFVTPVPVARRIAAALVAAVRRTGVAEYALVLWASPATQHECVPTRRAAQQCVLMADRHAAVHAARVVKTARTAAARPSSADR